MSAADPRQQHNTGLSARDRSMLNIAAAAALRRTDDLRAEIKNAPANGVSADEVRDILDQVVLLTDSSVADFVRIATQSLTDGQR
ncbi:MAG: carboxymuconolactone decarboxylase family protein [Acidobacteriaceae bacterium]